VGKIKLAVLNLMVTECWKPSLVLVLVLVLGFAGPSGLTFNAQYEDEHEDESEIPSYFCPSA
jgi:hypothetical protein